MNYTLLCFCLLGLAVASRGFRLRLRSHRQRHRPRHLDRDGIQSKLMRYGYMNPMNSRCTTQEYTEALARYQMNNHLPMTGTEDDSTRSLLEKSRCAGSDHPKSLPKYVKLVPRDYADSGYAWESSTITYNFLNYPSTGLTEAEVEEIFAWAAAQWAAVTCLTFVQQDTTSGIEVQFATGDYGGIFTFTEDGDNAYSYPPYPGFTENAQGGDIDVNDYYTYIDGCSDDSSEINLRQLFLHQIGESLGLEHSDVEGSVMEATYASTCIEDPGLSADDIEGIQSKYDYCTTTAASTTTTAASTTTTEPSTTTTEPSTTTTAASTTTTEPSTTTTAASTTTTEPSTTTTAASTTTTTASTTTTAASTTTTAASTTTTAAATTTTVATAAAAEPSAPETPSNPKCPSKAPSSGGGGHTSSRTKYTGGSTHHSGKSNSPSGSSGTHSSKSSHSQNRSSSGGSHSSFGGSRSSSGSSSSSSGGSRTRTRSSSRTSSRGRSRSGSRGRHN